MYTSQLFIESPHNQRSQYVYHVISGTNLNMIKRYGLCSPQKLYDINPSLLVSISGEIYKSRILNYLGRQVNDDITAEEILTYLNNSPQRDNLVLDLYFLVLYPWHFIINLYRIKCAHVMN